MAYQRTRSAGMLRSRVLVVLTIYGCVYCAYHESIQHQPDFEFDYPVTHLQLRGATLTSSAGPASAISLPKNPIFKL